MNNNLLQKIFGLLALVFVAISCGGDPGDSPGTTPDPSPTPAPKGISITPPSPIYIGLNTTNIFTVNFIGFTNEEDRSLTLSNGSPDLIYLPPYTNENNTNKDKTNFQVIAIALRNVEDSIISARVGEFTDIAVVRVVSGLDSITLSRTNITLEAGATATIDPWIFPFDADYTNLTWTSGNPAVATVVDGKVTGISEGTTTITASNVSGVSATATVTVTVTDIPGVTKLTVTKLTSTATPSDVRDRYAVFNIKAPSAMNNYRLAVAPAGTTLTAADMTAANNLGVHSYDLTTTGINVLMGFVYNAPLLSAIEAEEAKTTGNILGGTHTIFDDSTIQSILQSNNNYRGSSVSTGTGSFGKAGDIGRSLLQPNTEYLLYGLASGANSVTELLSFTTDPARYNVVADRNANAGVPLPERWYAPVDKIKINPLTINANNYNLYPLRFYIKSSMGMFEITKGLITLSNQGTIIMNPTEGYLVFPNHPSDYTSEVVSGTTVTPASELFFYHSMYYVDKSEIPNLIFTHSVGTITLEFY